MADEKEDPPPTPTPEGPDKGDPPQHTQITFAKATAVTKIQIVQDAKGLHISLLNELDDDKPKE